MRKFAVFLMLLLAFIVFPGFVGAQGVASESSAGSVEVKSIANIFDRLQEKITLFFKFSSQDKARYQKDLIEKRMAELEFVINSGQGDLIEEVSSRYAAYVGKFSDYVVSKNVTDEKHQFLVMFDSHLKILEELRDHFPSNSGFWLLLQHDINTVKIFSEKIKAS